MFLAKANPAAAVFDTPVGGPAVMPSGHACRDAALSGEDNLACQCGVLSLHSTPTRLFPTVTTAPV